MANANAPILPVQSVSFELCDVPVTDELLPEMPYRSIVEHKLGTAIEAHCHPWLSLVQPSYAHAFIETVFCAFSYHHPLVISPDHIWLLICQGFSRHVNHNADSLRPLFVRHTGRKKLEVVRPDFVKGSPDNAWEDVFPEFSEQIRANLLGDTHDLLVANFSTTSAVERAAFEITLMATFQAYFDYALSLCGIPSVTLEGNPEDWRSILERTRRLAAFDLDWWVDPLIPILEALVRTSEGRIDRDFWNNIYRHNAKSGGPFITGWLLNFFPYLDHAQRSVGRSVRLTVRRNPYLNDRANSRFKIDDATCSLATAPFKWDCGDKTYDMRFAAGFVGITQDHETKALRPEIGWAVYESEARASY